MAGNGLVKVVLHIFQRFFRDNTPDSKRAACLLAQRLFDPLIGARTGCCAAPV
jgi:hypothetical protein